MKYILFLIFIISNQVYAQNTQNKDNTNKIQNNSFYKQYKQEIYKRFSNDTWEQNLTSLSERALIQEYVRMQGISNHLNQMNIERKERIEALLATYTLLKSKQSTK